MTLVFRLPTRKTQYRYPKAVLTKPFTQALRCGDYRVFFDLKDENAIQISTVRHRREAYR